MNDGSVRRKLDPVGSNAISQTEHMFAAMTMHFQVLRNPIAMSGISPLLDLFEPLKGERFMAGCRTAGRKCAPRLLACQLFGVILC